MLYMTTFDNKNDTDSFPMGIFEGHFNMPDAHVDFTFKVISAHKAAFTK